MSEAATFGPPVYPVHDQGGETLRFDRAYGTLVNHIGRALESGGAVDFWDPGRLVKGLLDYKILRPDVIENVPALVAGTMAVAVGIHAGSADIETFEALEGRIAYYQGLRRSRVQQRGDNTTAKATNPALSQEAAKKLRDYTGNSDALFITLGHGGTTAGILTYLDYTQSGETSDSAIYPVRFSRAKKGDTKPRLNAQETKYLQTIAAERSRVVIFDEDCCFGVTLDCATAYFNELFDTDTIPVANDTFRHRGTLIGATALKRHRSVH